MIDCNILKSACIYVSLHLPVYLRTYAPTSLIRPPDIPEKKRGPHLGKKKKDQQWFSHNRVFLVHLLCDQVSETGSGGHQKRRPPGTVSQWRHGPPSLRPRALSPAQRTAELQTQSAPAPGLWPVLRVKEWTWGFESPLGSRGGCRCPGRPGRSGQRCPTLSGACSGPDAAWCHLPVRPPRCPLRPSGRHERYNTRGHCRSPPLTAQRHCVGSELAGKRD